MIRSFLPQATAVFLLAGLPLPALERPEGAPFEGHHRFDTPSPELYSSYPETNARIVDGALHVSGESGGKYPPAVGVPIEQDDCRIAFRYRHLSPTGMIWLFINGDDGFGGFDHLLRVKLNRQAVTLQVDAHTLNADHPDVVPGRQPDSVSGSYRAVEKLPPERVKGLDNADWQELELVFTGDTVKIRLNDGQWEKSLSRPGFSPAKQEVYLFLKGDEDGVELDDLEVTAKD